MADNALDKAREYFVGNNNCTQAVLRTILEEKGLYFNQALIVAAGFGGGISRRGEICGALTGAVMAIGVLHGQKYNEPGEHRKYTYESVGELIEKFKKCTAHSVEPFSDGHVDKMIELLCKLEEVGDVAEVAELLAPN